MTWDDLDDKVAIARILRLQYETAPAMLALFDRAWVVGDQPAIDAIAQKHDDVVREIRSY